MSIRLGRLAGVVISAGLVSGCGEKPASTGAGDAKGNGTKSNVSAAKGDAGVAKPAGGDTTPTPKIPPRKELDLTAVPPGGVREWLTYLGQVESVRISGTKSEERKPQIIQQQEAVIRVIDKLLAANVQPFVRLQITEKKLNSLLRLSDLEHPGAKEAYFHFAEEANKQSGRVVLTAEDEPTRVLGVKLRLNALYVLAGREEDRDSGTELRRLFGQAEEDANEEVKAHARQLRAFHELRELEQGRAKEPTAFVAAARQVVGVKSPGAGEVEFALRSASQLEIFGHIDAARQFTADARKALEANIDEKGKANVAKLFDAQQRRLDLFGKPFKIEGKLLDKQPLDWNSYRGKVVIVDFWTTWLPKTAERMEKLRELAAKHGAKNVQLLGVNFDRRRPDIEAFVAKHKIDWPIVANMPGEARDYEEPNLKRCGLEAPPALLVIDQRGRLVYFNDLGPRAEKVVAELVGGTKPAGKGKGK